jgi:isoamylase
MRVNYSRLRFGSSSVTVVVHPSVALRNSSMSPRTSSANSGLDSAGQTLPTLGRSAPLGASVEQSGVNFSVYSRDATRIDLLLFDSEDSPPSRVIPLDPSANRTYHYWHVFVPGLQPGQLYGYRAHGPFDPSQGLRFDASKVLLDPYGRGVIAPIGYSRDVAARNGYDKCRDLNEKRSRGPSRL